MGYYQTDVGLTIYPIVCDDCGTIVINVTKHDEFHKKLESMKERVDLSRTIR